MPISLVGATGHMIHLVLFRETNNGFAKEQIK